MLLVIGATAVWMAAQIVVSEYYARPIDVSSLPKFIAFLMVAGCTFVSSRRFTEARHAIAAALIGYVFFLFHPNVLMASWFTRGSISIEDTLVAAAFLAAWSLTEHWSLFMRSWVLAIVFAAGCWCESSMTQWIMVAFVPWILFSRQPWSALGGALTTVLGGLGIYGAMAGWVWIMGGTPHRFIVFEGLPFGRSGDVLIGLATSSVGAWFVMTLWVVAERLRRLNTERRADASAYAATLLAVLLLLFFYGICIGKLTWELYLSAMAVLAAPLIAAQITRREVLYHRGVWLLIGVSALLTIVGSRFTHRQEGLVTLVVLAVVPALSFVVPAFSRFATRLRVEAVLIGCFGGEAASRLLRLFLH